MRRKKYRRPQKLVMERLRVARHPLLLEKGRMTDKFTMPSRQATLAADPTKDVFMMPSRQATLASDPTDLDAFYAPRPSSRA